MQLIGAKVKTSPFRVVQIWREHGMAHRVVPFSHVAKHDKREYVFHYNLFKQQPQAMHEQCEQDVACPST